VSFVLFVVKKTIVPSGQKKERLDRLSPGKTQKPKGTFSRAALSCDSGKKTRDGCWVNEYFVTNVIFKKDP
jgi:hypothetical protein